MCVRTMFAPETNCPAALAVLSDRVATRGSDGDCPAVWDRPQWSKCHHFDEREMETVSGHASETLGQVQMTSWHSNGVASKRWPPDDADSTADKIRIRKDFGLDPDFIGVEVCAICGPSGVLPADTPF